MGKTHPDFVAEWSRHIPNGHLTQFSQDIADLLAAERRKALEEAAVIAESCTDADRDCAEAVSRMIRTGQHDTALDADRAAVRKEALEAAANAIRAAWTPSVGGYPDVNKLVNVILKS